MITDAFIGGAWVTNEETFDVNNPLDGSLLAKVTDCNAGDTHKAVDSASTAFQTWKKTTVTERIALMNKVKDGLLANQDQLGAIITKENGKPLNEAVGEVKFAASFFQWFAEEARRAYGDTIPSPVSSKRLMTIRQPLGVAAFITPWNFPIGMIGRKVAAAMAAGCTCVIKPAEDTPLVALAFAQVVKNAGVPDGVVNVVPCSRRRAPEVGKVLCTAPAVKLVSFTGSTDVGKLIYSQCSSTLKKMSMELGGDAPFIVFPSADMTKAVNGAIASKFRNTGQTCVTSNRFLVHSSIVDEFVSKLNEDMGKCLKIGVNIGPLINCRQHEKVVRIVNQSVKMGAKLVCGGKPGKNLFYEPTILTNVKQGMPAFDEEIFGPVVSIITFETEEEAVKLANASERGLAGYFYSQDLNQAIRVAEHMEVGMVGVNEGLVSTCEAPFGGVKASGFGKEGSRHGLDELMELKYICIGL